MTQVKEQEKKKGGRPIKDVKKGQTITIKCSLFEKRTIEARAKSANLDKSNYLRELGLTGKIDRREKTLPPEVLELKAILHHDAANLNQIAKKRNSNEELSPLERADLFVIAKRLKEAATVMLNYFQ